MSDDYKILVDGGRPATLNDGAGILDRLRHVARGRVGLAEIDPEQEDTSDRQADRRAGLYGAPDCAVSLRDEAGVTSRRCEKPGR